LPADRSIALVLALAATVIASTGLSAHRRDQYLQAARLAVEPGRVEVVLDLTPGIAVADAIIADIDRDGDGLVSAHEQVAYVGQVLSAVELQIDGRTLHWELVGFAFPDVDAFRQGVGTIRLQSAVVLPRLSEGDHRLLFRNTYRRDVSAYLANALVPESDRIRITAQRRDAEQRDLTIDYVVRANVVWPLPLWLLGTVAGAAIVTAFLIQASRVERRISVAPPPLQ
jgi:hypothetical protein